MGNGAACSGPSWSRPAGYATTCSGKRENCLPDFDAERAALLLRSYAESVEITLENSGVRTFAPEPGDPFDPRMHRRVGGQPPDDPALAGRIAGVIRDGYLDVDSSSPLAPAEVVVFGDPAATATPTATTERSGSQP